MSRASTPSSSTTRSLAVRSVSIMSSFISCKLDPEHCTLLSCNVEFPAKLLHENPDETQAQGLVVSYIDMTGQPDPIIGELKGDPVILFLLDHDCDFMPAAVLRSPGECILER